MQFLTTRWNSSTKYTYANLLLELYKFAYMKYKYVHSWLYFTQPVYLSAGVVFSVAGVLIVISTAVIIVGCVMMKRRQAFNVTSEWIKLS